VSQHTKLGTVRAAGSEIFFAAGGGGGVSQGIQYKGKFDDDIVFKKPQITFEVSATRCLHDIQCPVGLAAI